jgi:hypothetical protein
VGAVLEYGFGGGDTAEEDVQGLLFKFVLETAVVDTGQGQ